MNKIEELIQQLCPEGVVYKELGEMTKILNGYAFKSNKYTSSGIRVIRISDVQKGKMSDKDLKYYPIEMMDEFKSYILKENDLVMSLTGNVGRVAMLSERHLPAGLNQRVACIRTKNKEILTRFLFHFFDQNQFEIGAMTNATGGGQKNMSTTWLAKYMIPIPPLPVQQEIVNILDTFTLLEAELEAELEARKKQYEYYRNELLTFGDEVEFKELGDVVVITKGKQLNKELLTDIGPYPAYNGGISYSGFTDNYNYDENTIIISQGGASAGFVNFITTKFYANAHCYVVLPNNDVIINRYVYHFLKLNQERLTGKQHGAGIPALKTSEIATLLIPIPPLPVQQEIVNILDTFTQLEAELEAELEARKKQYEYYREKLLSFDRARNKEEKECAATIREQERDLFSFYENT